ncbi:hypothetical protein HUJ05_008795 [Dendroctonus ponderosae]|nr:hypothetical protein HUJ05_008795 [Dendroctonus ponderosae]
MEHMADKAGVEVMVQEGAALEDAEVEEVVEVAEVEALGHTLQLVPQRPLQPKAAHMENRIWW